MEFPIKRVVFKRIILAFIGILLLIFLQGCGNQVTQTTSTALPVYTITYTPFQPLPPETNETSAWQTISGESGSNVTTTPEPFDATNEQLTHNSTKYVDTSTETPTNSDPASTQPSQTMEIDELRLWVNGTVPEALKESIVLEGGVQLVEENNQANLIFGATEDEGYSSRWIFALVAPFPTVIDGVSSDDLLSAWGGKLELFNGAPIMMSKRTLNAFSAVWGKPAEGVVRVVNEDELLATAWQERPSWAIVPFEKLDPQWKVLSVDSESPIDKEFDANAYLLTVDYGFTGETEALRTLYEQRDRITIHMTSTNRDPEKLTVVIMTGVTALVRATGAKMEANGMAYPATDISDWLLGADITHISNEVSFAEDCPNADPYQKTLRFCSRPEYIDLLDAIDVDVVELSGNHLLDWSEEAFLNTLDLYDGRGWGYYAGGRNESEARQALKITHNGNKLAFIGCNLVGPPNDWATDNHPGSANCGDYIWILQAVRDLVSEGYLPIVTLQHNEFYSLVITPGQEQDFIPLAQAGAVIVSGSQAHYPNPFGFADGNFIHYGLGNLFFDQMDVIITPGIQREFLDRHVFYDNRYISTEILTAHLEEFSRPRPMTDEERAAFLEEAFKASGW